MKAFLKGIILTIFVLVGVVANAKEFVVEIMEYNSENGVFVLKTWGEKPTGSSVEFWNDYGAVYGNRYNQIPGNTENKIATLDLFDWGGCTIDSITISAASNKAAGNINLRLEVTDEANTTTSLYNSGVVEFNSASWYDGWVYINAGIYVDVTKEMTTKRPIADEEIATVVVTGGLQAGKSVYLHRITIHYTPEVGVDTESPMPYKFTQLLKNDVLVDGDVCIIATTNHIGASDTLSNSSASYMEATPIDDFNEIWMPENSYPELMFFTMHKTEDNHWKFVTQYGDTLGAFGARKVTWNKGVTTWDVTLGATYDGTTIKSTNSSYGYIQYNSSSPRFTTYTSAQTKVFLYRRGEQAQPVLPTLVEIDATRGMSMCSDTIILKPTILPKTTTDTRIAWKSLNPSVAVVKDGIVKAIGVGEAKIVATCVGNDEVADTCLVAVSECHAESIELSATLLTLHTCDTKSTTLTATVYPTSLANRSVTWLSSNEAVATVSSDGKVTPVAEGSALIVATSNESPSITASCTVKVDNCNISSISLKYPDTDSSFTLKDCGGIVDGEGERFSVWVVYTPTSTDDEVLWSSSNEAVAMVTKASDSHAIVKAIAAGSSTITAYSKANPLVKVTSVVTVTACSTSSTYTLVVKSADSTMGMVSGDGVYTKNATATITAIPFDGFKFNYWSDQDGAKYYSNPLDVKVTGNHTYTAYFEKRNTQITDVNDNSIEVYGGEGVIVLESVPRTEVTIYDVMGRIVHSKHVERSLSFRTNKGVYMVRINGTVTKVVVK